MATNDQPDPRPSLDMPPDQNPHHEAVYRELCSNYRAIDDFRTKLLGLLPFATALGILVGAGSIAPTDVAASSHLLGAVGAFGFLATLGLFSYELHGIKKCGWLIRTGSRMEETLETDGPFRKRPQQVAGFIDEPFAAAVIYPASLAAWAFTAVTLTSVPAAIGTAVAVFVLFLALSLTLIRRMEDDLAVGAEYVREPDFFARGRRRRREEALLALDRRRLIEVVEGVLQMDERPGAVADRLQRVVDLLRSEGIYDSTALRLAERRAGRSD